MLWTSTMGHNGLQPYKTPATIKSKNAASIHGPKYRLCIIVCFSLHMSTEATSCPCWRETWGTYLLGGGRRVQWHKAAWWPHRNGPWRGPGGRRPDGALWHTAGSGYWGWPAGRQSSGACQSGASGHGRRAASVPTGTKLKKKERKKISNGKVENFLIFIRKKCQIKSTFRLWRCEWVPIIIWHLK